MENNTIKVAEKGAYIRSVAPGLVACAANLVQCCKPHSDYAESLTQTHSTQLHSGKHSQGQQHLCCKAQSQIFSCGNSKSNFITPGDIELCYLFVLLQSRIHIRTQTGLNPFCVCQSSKQLWLKLKLVLKLTLI